MHPIIVDKAYRFIPSRHNRFWEFLTQLWLPGHLRKSYGLVSGECIGVEHLKASCEAGHGILLAPNHCRPCDPMVLARYLAPEVGRSFRAMASWHIFMQNRLQSFLLPRMGAFSVYREGLDRESIQHATQILAEGKNPLIVFPEGFITRSNDHLANLMDGVAFMARRGAKQALALDPTRKTVIHPIFIRYFFEGRLEAALSPVLADIETRLSWQPQTHLTLIERVEKLGQALLSLKEIEFYGAHREGPVAGRVDDLINHLIQPLERRWLKTPRLEKDTMERIKLLRTAMLPDLVEGSLSEAEKQERWRHFGQLYLAQQLHCYPDSYLANQQSPERLIETLERFDEDLTDSARFHAPMRAVICVGEAIEVHPERVRGEPADPLTQELRSRLEKMMQDSHRFRRRPPLH